MKVKYEKEVKISHMDKFRDKSVDVEMIIDNFKVTYDVFQGLEGRDFRVEVSKTTYRNLQNKWNIRATHADGWSYICTIYLWYETLGIEVEFNERSVNSEYLKDLFCMFNYREKTTFVGRVLNFDFKDISDLPMILDCFH